MTTNASPRQLLVEKLAGHFEPVTRRDGFVTYRAEPEIGCIAQVWELQCAARHADPQGPLLPSDYTHLWIVETLQAVAVGPEAEAVLLGETNGECPDPPDMYRWLDEGDCARTERFRDWKYLMPRGDWGTLESFECIVRASLEEARWLVHQAVINWLRAQCGDALA